MFNSIKAILSTVWEILCATGEAKYAAELARNQKWTQAQDLYKKQQCLPQSFYGLSITTSTVIG